MQKELGGSYFYMKKTIVSVFSGLLLILSFTGLGETQNVNEPPLAPPAKAWEDTKNQILDEIALLTKQFVKAKQDYITSLEIRSKPVIGTGIEFTQTGKIIYVESVSKGSSGDQAGVKDYDVLVSLNGKQISPLELLVEELEGQEKQPGRKSSLTLLRDGKIVTVQVTTAVIHEDRTAQIKVLIEKMDREFPVVLQKISNALGELIIGIETGAVKKDDMDNFSKHPLAKKINLAIEEYVEWGQKIDQEAAAILGEPPVQH